ncbi:secretin and TonB N-terminal domain-containing protein [Pseudoalteromonas arctica]|uniref:TonB-dependent receptor n=1 Tax=Pseudoalteromonas arctica TaxID=394751 RepID=A0A7Y0HCY6_9GAMM|nr:secretin and TonB N-terminal domain-containing protein [Pseudoalteromonas arctica]NMM40599.1 TonB-dependent receptor [Pseudoalteromonas arctica]
MLTTSRHSSKLTTTALALGLVFSQPLAAQTQATIVTFNIAPQPLSQALNQLAEQANMSLIADASLLKNLQAPALYGQKTVRDALVQTLQGTAIKAEIVGNTIILKTATTTATSISPTVKLQPSSANSGKQYGIEVIVVKGDQIQLNREPLERSKGSSNSDIFSTHTSIEANNLRNEAGALDIGIRGVQGEGRVPVFIDGSLQSTHTNRGYMGTSDRTYIDSDLISTVAVEKGSSVKGSLFNAGAIGGTVNITTLSTSDILKAGQNSGALIKLKTYNNNHMPTVSDNAYQQQYYLIRNHNSSSDFDNGAIMLAGAYQTKNLKTVFAYSNKKVGNYFAGKNGYENFVEEYEWGGKGLPPVNQGGEVVNTSFESESYLAKAQYAFNEEHEIELNTRHHQQQAGEMLASYWHKQKEGDFWRLPNGEFGYIPAGIETMPQWQPGSALVNSASASYRYLPTNNTLVDLKVNAWTTNAKLNQYNALGSNFGPNALQYLHEYSNQRQGLGIFNTSSFNMAAIPTTLIYGVSWQDEVLKPKPGSVENFYGDLTTSRNGKQTERSLFINTHLDLDPVGLSLNLNHHDSKSTDNQTESIQKFDPKTDITAQIYYRVLSNTILKAKFSHAYRMPNLYETTVSNEVFSYSPYYPITPETTHSFETGIVSNFSDLLINGDKLTLSTTYFDTQINNMLATANLPNKDPNQQSWELSKYTFINYDSFKLPGIELALDYQGDFFYSSVSYTNYTNIEMCSSKFVSIEGVERCNSQGFSGSLTPLRIPPKRNLVATLGKTFLNDALDSGLIYKGHSEKYHPSGFLSGTGAKAITWIPASYQLDFYIDYQFNDSVSGYTTVTNLTNRYIVSSGSIVAMPEPGRTITLGLEFKL